MELWERICEEFKLTNFLFSCRCPARFVQMECGNPRLYMVWRLVWMSYHLAAIVSSGYLEQFYATTPENRVKWFVFLTNWTYIILTVGTVLDFCSTLYVQYKHPDWLSAEHEMEVLPWYLQTVWALSNISNTMSILVSVSYWTSGAFDPVKGLMGHHVLPFLGHGMNTIYIVCNLCVTAIPVRLLHVWVPLVFTFIYGVFNFAYIYMGGTDDADHHYIYPPIDWRQNPLKAEILAILVLIGVLVSHSVVFVFHVVRVKVAQPCVCTPKKEVTEDQSCQANGDVGKYGSTVRARSS